MTSAATVASYVIRFFQDAGDPVSNLKLQKLLYYIQGWHLALRKQPLFPDRFEAWVHGPVVPSVYGSYKQYRWQPIIELTTAPYLDPDAKFIVDEVLRVYGGDTGYSLEQRTHMEPPWQWARGGLAPDQESRALISPESMQQFFESQIPR
ncbi:Uncharacterized phage-associated protein [Variovorax sp. YR266]|uniref:Panacea domain-containing protein n=1 Tax=Variovorax sp. YR266 TaxID=1884386 RepID=UPI0008953182|nr:type II toxin-antitoxin system antitoxin SocA domain-containing protein [Variovorax sp. YR266]SDY02400.1 Uncharacterized phage-associated protein [Variovorax sp. YR266]